MAYAVSVVSAWNFLPMVMSIISHISAITRECLHEGLQRLAGTFSRIGEKGRGRKRGVIRTPSVYSTILRQRVLVGCYWYSINYVSDSLFEAGHEVSQTFRLPKMRPCVSASKGHKRSI